MRNKLMFLTLLFGFLISTSYAEIVTYEKTVKKIIGTSQSIDDAKTMAVADAKREIIEQAGTYIQSISVVKNGQLVQDDISAIAMGVLKTQVISMEKILEGDSFGIVVTVRADVDTATLRDKIDRIRDNKELLDKYKKINNSLNEQLAINSELEEKVTKLEQMLKTANEQQRQYIDEQKKEAKIKYKEIANTLRIDNLIKDSITLIFDSKYAHPTTERDAKIYIQELGQAHKKLDKVLRLDPKNHTAFNLMGVISYQVGSYAAAIDYYSLAIKFKPNDSNTYSNRALAYIKTNQIKLALKDFNNAIKLDPNNRTPYENRSNLYKKLGKYDLAIKDHKAVIQLDPESYRTYFNYYYIGHIYKEVGEYSEAIKYFDISLNMNPQYADSYLERGISYHMKKEYMMAEKDYTMAISLEDKPDYYNNRSLLYMDSGKYDLAIKDITTAINAKHLTTNKAAYYNTRGLIYYNLEKYEQAIEDYNSSLSLNPKYALSYHRRGISFLDLKKYNKAVDDFTSVIKLEPNNAEAYLDRAKTFYFLKENSLAIKDYTRAIELAPKNPYAYISRGAVYYISGETDKGCNDMNTACKLGNCQGLNFNDVTCE